MHIIHHNGVGLQVPSLLRLKIAPSTEFNPTASFRDIAQAKPDQLLHSYSIVDNQSHKNKVFVASVYDTVRGTARRPGRVACADSALDSIVVVLAFTSKEEVALTVSIMAMIWNRHPWRNSDTRVERTLVA